MKAEQSGESKQHGSNTNNANSSTAGIIARSSKALVSQPQGRNEARFRKKREAAAGYRESDYAARAGALQAVQARLVGNCGTHSERARHAVCLPVLPEVAPRSRTGAGLQEDSARAMGPFAPRGGIGERWHVH